ncbi:MAG: TonB-dependent receptor [Acidobacteriota bacterium]|nr:TonB-dependent receptor [Acidobacteriota bacterium]
MKPTFWYKSVLAVACIFSLSLLPAALPAQTAALGNISGIVRDSSGAVVAGATVEVINSGTGASRSVTTDSEGHYVASFLQPGVYEVIAGGGSFGKVDRKSVNVQVGQIVTIDADLPAASVSTSVVVTTEAPLLDTDKVAVNQVVSQTLVDNLPVNGRRFDNFVLATPNVVPDGTTGLISFRGISGIYNSNLVDGANNNQAFFSEARGRSIGAPYVYPVDAIKEFSSENAGYSAEFGQAAGGIINAVTKSGSNALHGDAYELYRTPGYNAIDPLTKSKPVKVQHQFGVSVGGPILKDKLFYHFTYDGYRKVTPISYISTYGNLNNLAALCDQRTSGYLTTGSTVYPSTIPGISPTQCTAAVNFLTNTQLGTYGRNVKQDIFFPRLDYQLTPSTHLSTSFLWQNFHQPNGYNTATTVTNGGISQNGTADFHSRFFVFNVESVVSARAANVVHFQWGRDLETDTTNSGGPANSIAGIAAYGETSALPRGAFPDEHRIQFTDIYSTSLGRHTLKAGLDLNFIHEQLQNLFQGDGSFTYSTGTNEYNFANWIQDVYQVNGGRHYNFFTQVNDPITHVGADDFWNPDIDFFVEDSWKVTPKLLLSLGGRYDLQLVPQPDKPNTSSAVAQTYTSTINNYKGMVQPRLGFSWNPYNGTVVRGGYGIFYGLNSNSAYYTQRRENGVYQQQFNANATTSPNLPYASATTTGATCVPVAPFTRCFQQSGAYASYAPQGGIPAFTPPGPAPTNLVTGAPITAVNPGLPTSVLGARGLDPNFKNPESMSWDLTVEQQIPWNSTLTIGYVGNRGLRLPVFVDTNVDPTSAVTNTYYYYSSPTAAAVAIPLPFYTARLSTNTGSVLTGFSDVNSNYHSMVTTIRKPFRNGVEILANYTWAKSMDGGQVSGVNGTFNGTDTPIIPFATGKRSGRSAEYARSDLDVRGRFVASIVASPTVDHFIENRYARYAMDGFTLSGTVTAQDGEPLTAFMASAPASKIGDGGLTGAELSLFNSGTNGRVPDAVAARNAFKGPGIHNVDARISRSFPLHEGISLQVLAEAFNLANHKNILSVATTGYTYITPGSSVTTSAGTISCSASLGSGCITPLPSTSTKFATPTGTSSILYGPRQLQLTAKLFF